MSTILAATVPIAICLAVQRYSFVLAGFTAWWFIHAIWRTRRTRALRPDLDWSLLSDDAFGVFLGSFFYAIVFTLALAPLLLAAYALGEAKVEEYLHPPGDPSGYSGIIFFVLMVISIPWLGASLPLLHWFNRCRRARLPREGENALSGSQASGERTSASPAP